MSHVSPIRISETLTILTRLEKDETEDIRAIDMLTAKLQTTRALVPEQFRLQIDSAINDLVSFRQSEASELGRLREISRLMTGS